MTKTLKKLTTVSVRMPEVLLILIGKEAKKEGRSKSNLIVRYLWEKFCGPHNQ